MVTYEVTTIVDPRLVEAATHATRLREDFGVHFPEGVTASREVWIAIQSWSTPRGDSR